MTYEVDGSELTLTPSIVCRYLTGGRQDIPLPEIAKFMMLCKARRLNPFAGDVFLTAYNGVHGLKTSIVTGKETFTKRAMRNPRFRGMEAGVSIWTQDGRLVRREGSLVLGGERLVGGWGRVYVEGWEKPSFDEVSFDEYNTGRSLWEAKPATMIRKVGLVHALREAFPDEFGELYDACELGVEQPEAPDGGFVRPEAAAERPEGPEYEAEEF